MRQTLFAMAALAMAVLPWFWYGASVLAAVMSLPWLLLLPSLLRGSRRAQQFSSLLAVPYFVHATTLLVTGEAGVLAALELGLSCLICIAAIGLGRRGQT